MAILMEKDGGGNHYFRRDSDRQMKITELHCSEVKESNLQQ